MLRVMIVDDEPLFRDYLNQVINWIDYGFDIVNVSKNGREAWLYLQKSKVDIALLDINMPFMDGIELTKQINDSLMQTEVVLISGHHEFQYALEAIKLGVKDFILKPFNRDELVQTMTKIKEEFDDRDRKAKQEQFQRNQLKQLLLNDWINEEKPLDTQYMRRRLEEIDVTFSADHIQVVTIEAGQLDERWESIDNLDLCQFALINVWNDMMQQYGTSIVFKGRDHNIIVILELRNQIDIQHVIKTYCNYVYNQLNQTVYVGVGNIYKGIENIHQSYKEAVIALRNQYSGQFGKVIMFNELKEEQNNIGFYSAELNESMLVHLRSRDWEKVLLLLTSLGEEVKKQKVSMEYVHLIFMGLTSLLLSFVKEQGLPLQNFFSGKKTPVHEINKRKSISELLEWMQQLVKQIKDIDGSLRETRTAQIANSVRLYIDQYYSDELLSIEKLAKVFYVHESYLRATFKKQMSISISKYLLQVRMNQAKSLLEKKQYKISAISEMTGFSDSSYFSKVFKKYFGVKPSEIQC
ncbi:response regulator [Paenibacillus chungangensis]|uniref:Response regulator n=1 Tax=Paenibacillus chungangensis TaxID=696535 RepID=A0ABW3HL64_9BACL